MATNAALDYLKRLFREARSEGNGSFGLYLGAGVNLAPTPAQACRAPVRTYTWTQLLAEMYRRINERQAGQGAEQTHRSGVSFDTLLQHYGNDWPRLAARICQALSPLYRKDLIDGLFYEGFSRGDQDRRLPRSFLRQAPTLHAAICLSAAIHRVKRRNVAGSWGFEPNPAVGLVITPNYDYLFGAGWTLYQCFPWQVVTPVNPHADEDTEKKPIYYLHGYVNYHHFACVRSEEIPHACALAERLLLSSDSISRRVRGAMGGDRLKSLRKAYRAKEQKDLAEEVAKALNAAILRGRLNEKRPMSSTKPVSGRSGARTAAQREAMRRRQRDILPNRLLLEKEFPGHIAPLSHDLVLTTAEYRRAYKKPEAFARCALAKAIAQHHMIFLGTSFRDAPLCSELEENKKRQGPDRRRCFVIAPKSSDMNPERAATLGLDWIDTGDYEEIPQVLKEVYCHGLQIPAELKTLIPEGDIGRIETPEDYWRVLEYGSRRKGRKSASMDV